MENQKLYVLREVIEKGFGNADLQIIDQYIDKDWKEHQLSLRGGMQVLKKAILSLDAAFSNRQYVLQNYVVNEDIVWVHYRLHAIHTGPFMGHPPTGKHVSIDVMDIARVPHLQIVEHWGIPDRFSLLMQLGFLPNTQVAAKNG